MNRLLFILLLFVIGSPQSPILPLGRVTGHHVEAVAELSTYNGTLIDGQVSFAWRSEYLDINSADDRNHPVKCDFIEYDAYHKRVKQSCDITHYLIVDYQNATRYCEVAKWAWETIDIGQLVTISVTAAGELVCSV